MASVRTIVGGLGSIALHAAVLASWAGAPPPQLPTATPDDELVVIDVLGTEPVGRRPHPARGPAMDETPASSESAATETPPEPEPPASRSPRPRPRPRAEAEPTPEPAVGTEPSPGDGAASPEDEAAADGDGARVGEPGSNGSGATEAKGGGTFDSSGYGKEIVRLFREELDADPVPGLRWTDAIRVVIRVKPDGSLSWMGSGRYDFAQVLASTVGPVRTRAILKRLERASWRFPPYPAGLKGKRHYEMEFIIKFR